MLHPSQVIVRIRNVDGRLADLGLNEVYDYTLENGVIEFKMKPEIGEEMFIIGETATLDNLMNLIFDLDDCYKEKKD